MELELFLHGVPKGKSYKGLEEDRLFFSTFYKNGIDEDLKLTIQPRLVNNKTYYYYHLLQYKNVKDSAGRNGSYFGLSIRIDSFCHNAIKIYNILSLVYERYVLGSILKVEDNGFLAYQISEFRADTIQPIETAIISIFSQVITGADFSYLKHGNIGTASLFLYDASNERVTSSLKKSASLSIALWYPSIIEASLKDSFETRLSTESKIIRQNCQAQINELALQLEESQNNEKSLSTELNGTLSEKDHYKSLCEKLKAEHSELKIDYEKALEAKEILKRSIESEVAQKVKAAKSDLQLKTKECEKLLQNNRDLDAKVKDLERRLKQEEDHSDIGGGSDKAAVHIFKKITNLFHKQKYSFLIVISLVLAILVLCICYFGRKTSYKKVLSNREALELQVQVLSAKLDSLNNAGARYDSRLIVGEEETIYKSARIVINGHDDDDFISLGTDYTISINNVDCKIVRWEGANLKISEPNGKETTIIPNTVRSDFTYLPYRNGSLNNTKNIGGKRLLCLLESFSK